MHADVLGGQVITVGIDTGGTFVDYVLFDEAANKVYLYKHLSVPEDRARSVRTGLQSALSAIGKSGADVRQVFHGTTVGINALIERKGRRLALLVTKGFKHILELGRLRTPVPYDLFSKRPKPLVPLDAVIEVRERLLWNGDVQVAVAEGYSFSDEEAALIERSEAVVISLLHSYKNNVNEIALRDEIKKRWPEKDVILSSEIWPATREYERTIIACIEAYVSNTLNSYLDGLQDELHGIGFKGAFYVTRSDGGSMRYADVHGQAVMTLLSGTASGVQGAAHLARDSKSRSIITLDIGGTSSDIASIKNGEIATATGERVGEFILNMPTVSVASIGQGGGTIIDVDDLGALKVGPGSAGAMPGPVCYGHPLAMQPTLTDAFVVLGWIKDGAIGFGRVKLQRERSVSAFEALRVKSRNAFSTIEEIAWAAIRIAVSEMYVALAKSSAKAGMDYRDSCLLPFGGAGPLFAPLLAYEAGMKHILLPRMSGVLSAFGSAIGDIKEVEIRAINKILTNETVDQFKTIVREDLEQARGPGQSVLIVLEARYKGQSFEVDISVDAESLLKQPSIFLVELFHSEHMQRYGLADKNAEIEIMHMRLERRNDRFRPSVQGAHYEDATREPQEKMDRNEDIYIDGAYTKARHLDWTSFCAWAKHGGVTELPIVVARNDATLFVPAGYRVEADVAENIHLYGEA